MSGPSPSLGSVRRCWNAFFHSAADPRVCALIRIGYAALVLVNLAVLYPYLDEFFGESGVLPYEVSRSINDPDCWTVLGWLPQTSTVLHVCFSVSGSTLHRACACCWAWRPA
jgi:hypothetical protein